eukprot:gene42200-51535_t
MRQFSSQYHMHTLLSVGEWFDQMPIGNGRLGAFVGGSPSHEVIPLSTAGYYVYEKEGLKKEDMEGFEGYTKRADNGRLYHLSRHALYNRGDFTEASSLLRKIETSGLGLFQGSVDLVLKYGSVPWAFRPQFTQPHIPPEGAPRNARHKVLVGRRELLNTLSSCIIPSELRSSTTSKDTEDDVIHY